MVFKFERERTAFAVSYPYMFYVKNKSLCSMSIDTGVETVMVSLTAPGKPYTPPLGMSYNPAEKAIIVYDVRLRLLLSMNADRLVTECGRRVL